MKQFNTLYKRDSNDRIQEWTIKVEGNSYSVLEGLTDGKLTQTEPHICESKNPGKKNATTAEEQAIKEANAKFKHKLAHGYSLTKKAVDDTGYSEPMLAKQYEDYADDIDTDLWVDDKLNGVRLNALRGVVKSRKGKLFHTIPHIVDELKPLFDKYPKLFLDGELFNPILKETLNKLVELASVAYQPKDLTPELLAESKRVVQFWVYDGFGFNDITINTPFPERRAALIKLLKDFDYVKVLKYRTVKNGKSPEIKVEVKKKISEYLAETARNKGEGLIIRYAPCPYEFKRSKYLLKAKNFLDAEFEIEDVQEGNGGWSGCAKRIVLKLPKSIIGRDGKIQTNFASNIEGDQEYLRKMLKDRKKYIGLQATCRFQQYSEYGVPQIPYVTNIRNFE